jgi:hypothetical protein
MVDDLLRSGCMGAVPVYIEPENCWRYSGTTTVIRR